MSKNLYPKFIKNNKILNSIDNKKIFPELGLKNCRYSFSAWNVPGMYEASIEYLKQVKYILTEFNSDNEHNYDEKIFNIIQEITCLLDKDPSKFISKDYFGIQIPKVMKRIGGKDLFKIINYIYNNSVVFDINNIIKSIIEHNPFTALNKDGLNIVFSGNKEKCKWDIATMSMRGITSCQRWDSSHRDCLVGSIADPYAGIIYIEDPNSKNKYGSKMIRRSVVRFVKSKITKTNSILLERIYPRDYDNEPIDYITLTAFKNFINKKTDYKYNIIYGEDLTRSEKYFIPKNKIIDKLQPRYHSYRDSEIDYE